MFLTCNGSHAIVEESLWKFKLTAATNEIQSLWNASGQCALKDVIAILQHKADMEVKLGRVSAANVAKHWNNNYGAISDDGKAKTVYYVDGCLYIKTKPMVMAEIVKLPMDDVKTSGHEAFFDTAMNM